MIWIYLGPALFLAVIAALFFMAAFFGDADEDNSMVAALTFVGAWLWPLVIPLAILTLIVMMIAHIFIMFELMKRPEWWPVY